MAEFQLLGPVQLRTAKGALPLGPPKQRSVLAALLVDAGQPVPTETLVDRAWGDSPPVEARNALYTHIMNIRRVLAEATGTTVRLDRRSSGYVLDVDPDQVDYHRFRHLVDRARDPQTGDHQAAELLRTALELWQGTPLADLSGSWIERIRAGWRQQRLEAQLAWARIELRLGDHELAIDQLRDLTHDNPLVEPLAAVLIHALVAAGRTAEALDHYASVRRRLADELGTDPGPELQQLHRAILRGDLEPAPPPLVATSAAPIVPRQLPADIADFTGRERDLACLDSALDDPAVGVTVVSGIGGVGKTTLAVHWAHRVANQFPDGQLYVNLRGYAQASPVQPADVLPQFLRALGIAGDQLPCELDELAALYRSMLVDKRMLVVLDNAATAQQVRPLLPGNRESHVVITSRDQLTGLVAHNAARRIDLSQLEPEESTALLGKIAGTERIQAEAEASASIARFCGHLPLALKVIAAHLVGDPYRSLRMQADELEDLDHLEIFRIDEDVDYSLTGTFDLSYERLADDAQELFRLASLNPSPEFSAEAVSALANMKIGEANRLLGRLATCHLLERRGPARYAFHDLLRLYARQRCQHEDDQRARDLAVTRLLRWYLATANEAIRLILPAIYRLPVDIAPADPKPSFENSDAAMAWLEAERPNLVLIVQLAADHHGDPPAWLFTDVLRGFYYFTRHIADWLTVSHLGLSTAKHTGSSVGMAGAEVNLTQAYRSTSDYDAAQAHGTRALRLSRDAGWREGEATTLNELAIVHFEQGRMQSGIDLLEQAIAIDREVGNSELEGMHRMNVAMVYWTIGRLPDAAEHLEHMFSVDSGQASPQRRALVLANLATFYIWLGRLDDAHELLQQALAIHDEIRSPASLVATHAALANLALERGHIDRAREHADTVAELAKTTGSRRMQGHGLSLLADAERRSGNVGRAVELAERAVGILTEGATPMELLDGLLTMGSATLDAGDLDRALDAATSARTTAAAKGARAYEGKATSLLAEVQLRQGDLDAAVDLAETALAIHRDTGHLPGETRTLRLLDRITERRGEQ